MSLEQALEKNTEALLKLCEIMSTKEIASSVYIPQMSQAYGTAEPKTVVKGNESKGKSAKVPEPKEIELPGKTYAEHAAELETDDLIEETIEQVDDKPAITADDLVKQFRVFAGLNRDAAIKLLAKYGLKRIFGDDGKPALPGDKWAEFAEQCHGPG